ncbi:patatin-like phospholipase family protein [Roseivivax marinus]|uniref:patatin-like phospholipase family protein n=1 Tax=Roseivivax marinus TaxID=1379903 RepID=UPI0008C17625|nr:patatin-like phospholipase family protein [Roseivivax marinus]UMA65130.1 patatin-like phospholipase family protein [Roseivivax marinus]SEK56842.1 Patatin-like phospholipase [Roseivivax marinus]
MAQAFRSPDQMVFSGGGLRCFWQGGFLEVVAKEHKFAPKRVTGVSGGALSAVGFLSGRESALYEEMCAAFRSQETNHNAHSLFDEKDGGLTPHQEIYCSVVEKVIDAEAERIIADGPQLQILIAHPPASKAPATTGAAMALAYQSELYIKSSPHFGWAEKMGLTSTLVDANQAARDGKLVHLICSAATIPPVFKPPNWDDKPVIDGGMADQAPMPDPDEGETMILLTREYRNLPNDPRRTYIEPSKETPADKIDFTDPEKLGLTWRQGEADGRRWLDGRL